MLAGQFQQWMSRREQRSYWFNKALEKSVKENRKLIVIGDPDGGWTHGDYGYGDLCLDLTGCPLAPNSKKFDLSKDSIPLPDNSSVVFSPFVLDLIDNPEYGYKEMLRVAGNTSNLFILVLKPCEWAFYTYPGVKSDIECVPFYNEFKYKSSYRRDFSYDR